MNRDPFEQLSASEREELAICGITTAEQFSHCTPAGLMKDLKLARQCFAEKTFTLTEERLSILLDNENHTMRKCQSGKATDVLSGLKLKGEGIPTTGMHSHHRRDMEEFSTMTHHSSIAHSPVRTNHPVQSVFAAICTLLLTISILAFAAIPAALLFREGTTASDLTRLVILALAPTVPYLLFARIACCPVCHMRIFRFHKYTRNKAAHNFPLLGYNMSTALHLLFRLFYVCPACGTPVRLTRSRHR